MITTYTEDELAARAVSAFQTAHPGRAVHGRAFLGQHARAVAQLLTQIQAAVRDADRDGVPATEVVAGVLRSRCSTARLDEWAYVFGLPSNQGAGKYGRNGAQAATGGAGAVTGTAATVVGTGDLLTDASGQVVIELVSGVTIPAGGSISGSFQATKAGASGNLAAGTKLYWVSPPAGLDPTVTLSTATSGGYDSESDLYLVLRLLRHLQNPPKGGTPSDVRTWAEEAADSVGRSLGIVRAYVYPRRNGTGSVDVVITQAGTGTGRDPGSTKLTAAQAYLDTVRPRGSGCQVRVLRPYFDSTQKLKIKIKVTPTARHAFDWSGGSAGTALVAGTTASLLKSTTGSTPQGLLDAVTLGKQPRVLVYNLSASPLPYTRRVVSYATAGGNRELTLDSALPFTPSVGDLFYPGGGAVDPVAISVLSHIDQIGPSKQSGLADTITDSWEGKVTIAGIVRSVLNATDADGVRPVLYEPDVGTGVGCSIAVGVGAYSGSDFILYDNWPSNGPQLPEANQILVIEA